MWWHIPFDVNPSGSLSEHEADAAECHDIPIDDVGMFPCLAVYLHRIWLWPNGREVVNLEAAVALGYQPRMMAADPHIVDSYVILRVPANHDFGTLDMDATEFPVEIQKDARSDRSVVRRRRPWRTSCKWAEIWNRGFEVP